MRSRKVIAQFAIVFALATSSVLRGCDCTVRVFVESDATFHHPDGSGAGADGEHGTGDEGPDVADVSSDLPGMGDGEEPDGGGDGGPGDVSGPCFANFPCPFSASGGPTSGTLCRGNDLYQCETYTIPECEGLASTEVLLTTCPAGCLDANDGKAVCKENTQCAGGEDGDIVFTFQADAKITSTPAIGADGTIYFGTVNATFYAVGCDGKKKWDWKCPCEVWAFEGSPAIGADGTIYVGEDFEAPNYLFALNPDGTEKWRHEVQGLNEVQGLYAQIAASPALGSDGTIYIGQGGWMEVVMRGALLGVGPDGKVRAGFPVACGAVFASSAVSGGVVYATDLTATLWVPYGGTAFAVAADGTIAWRTDLPAGYEGSSIAVGGQGYIYFGMHYAKFDPIAPPPEIAVVDAATGQIARRVPVGAHGRVVGSPVVLMPNVETVEFNEAAFVMTEDGYLVTRHLVGNSELSNEAKIGDRAYGAPIIGDDFYVYVAAVKDDFTFSTVLARVWPGGADTAEEFAAITGEEVSTSLAMGNGGVLYFGTESGKLIAVKTGATGIDRKAPWPTFRHDDRNTGNADYVPK